MHRIHLNGFVGSLSISSGALTWSSFVGSAEDDVVQNMVVDEQNHKIFLSGITTANAYASNSCSVPTNGGFPDCHSGDQFHGAIAGELDAFVMKFDGQTHEMEWSTIAGGGGQDLAHALATMGAEDGTRYILVAGTTLSGSFGTSGIPVQFDPNYYFQDTHADYSATDTTHEDGFVWIFDDQGHMVLGTYIGGVGNDDCQGIAGYGGERVYMTGRSYSTADFPFNCPPASNPYCNQSYISNSIGTSDIFHEQIRYDVTASVQDRSDLLGEGSDRWTQPNAWRGLLMANSWFGPQ